MPLPPVSVIICSRNRPTFLVEAVQSVLNGAEGPAELIVVDQSDVSSEVLGAMNGVEGCKIRYLWTPGQGVSRARNAGLRAAQCGIVAFTDDDVLVHPAWLGALIRPLLEFGDRTVTTGRVLPMPEPQPGIGAPTLVLSGSPVSYRGRIARDVLQAGNMALHRHVLLEVRGFDERLGPGTDFPAGEDNDLGLRLLTAGCLIRYAPEAIIYHRAWREPKDYVPLRWRYGIGQGAYYAKHLRIDDRHMLRRLLRLLWRHSALALRRARREPRAATGHLAYMAGLLSGMAKWWSRGAKTS